MNFMYINNYNSVADIYDIYNQSNYDIDFYLQRYQNFRGKAIELMAGTGRLAIPLIKSGMRLDCLDISDGLLEKLTDKLNKQCEPMKLNTQVFHADMRKMKLERLYDLVIIGFNSFSEIIDENDRDLIFQSIYRCLNHHGEFVFSLYNPEYRRKYIDNALTLVNEYQHENQTVLFFITSKENPDNIVDVIQQYEFYNTDGSLENKQLLKLKFQLISKTEIENLILKTGFIIKNLFGNYDESPFDEDKSPFMIYILSK